jgi:hypothetical protein
MLEQDSYERNAIDKTENTHRNAIEDFQALHRHHDLWIYARRLGGYMLGWYEALQISSMRFQTWSQTT